MAEPESAHAVEAVNSLDPLKYCAVPEAEQESLLKDVVAKLDAATALVYAIYHCGKDNVLAMPESVLMAYARCCSVFDPKGSRPQPVVSFPGDMTEAEADEFRQQWRDQRRDGNCVALGQAGSRG